MRSLPLVIATLTVGVLAACRTEDTFHQVANSEFLFQVGEGDSSHPELEGTWISRGEEEGQCYVLFTLPDGTQTRYTCTDEVAEGPRQGCEDQVTGGVSLQVLQVDAPGLTLGSVTFERPVIVAGCEERRVFLTEGEESATEGPCVAGDPCLEFADVEQMC